MKSHKLSRKTILVVAFLGNVMLLFSQADTMKAPALFSGAVTVTTKGISTFPNLTLGKPAAIFDLAMGRKLTFEPQFRFDLEGKPWTFILWGRYKLISGEKFRFNIGAHPAFTFKTQYFPSKGDTNKRLVANRYLATELAPVYLLSKNTGIGLYYIYSYGADKEAIRHSHFISVRSSFSNIKLTDKFFIRFNPQVYYLMLDENGGFYFNATLILLRKNFPLSVSSQVNRKIHSNLPIGEDLLWNVSLIYSFSKKFLETK